MHTPESQHAFGRSRAVVHRSRLALQVHLRSSESRRRPSRSDRREQGVRDRRRGLDRRLATFPAKREKFRLDARCHGVRGPESRFRCE